MDGVDEAALAAELTGLLSELIAIPSPYPPGDSTAICAFAAERLRRAGYDVEVARRRDGVDNTLGRLGDGGPELAFNAHVDTVAVGEAGAWRTDPYRAVVQEGRLYGLGAGNCKGSMAVQLWLAAEIARRGGPRRGRVSFSFVGDEERLGPDGSAYLRELGKLRPAMLVLGAPTGNQLVIEERGVMWVRLTTRGRTAHAGDPSAGDNAILRMLRLLARLEAELSPRLADRVAGAKRSTVNLGRIRGGHNTNAVPDLCTAELDRRLLPAETVEAAYAEIRELLAASGEPDGSWEAELLAGTNGFSAPKDGACVGAFGQAIEARTGRPARFLEALGVSDGRWFADDGIEILNFGPGEGAQGHAANESVAVAELVDAGLIQLAAVDRLLGLADG